MRRLRLNGSGKTLLLIISLAFNFGVCIALAVQQQQPHEQGKPRWSRDRHDRDWLAKRLNLSEEQAAAADASRDKLFKELHELGKQVGAESDVLADLLVAPEPDANAVAAQVEKIADLRSEIQWKMIEHFRGVRQLLEPEQLQTFKEVVRRCVSGPGSGDRHGRKPPDGEAGPRRFPGGTPPDQPCDAEDAGKEDEGG